MFSWYFVGWALLCCPSVVAIAWSLPDMFLESWKRVCSLSKHLLWRIRPLLHQVPPEHCHFWCWSHMTSSALMNFVILFSFLTVKTFLFLQMLREVEQGWVDHSILQKNPWCFQNKFPGSLKWPVLGTSESFLFSFIFVNRKMGCILTDR